MKRITQEEYTIAHELLCQELQNLTHYSYMKCADLDRLNKDIDVMTVLKEKIEERIK